jgi:HD-like signal output (HDOD) protein
MNDAVALSSTLTTKLKGHALPVIRQTAAQVIAMLSNPSSNVQTTADLILRDQAFTARVLKVANSAYYRRSAEKITTISRAIIQIGSITLRDIAIAAEFAEFAQKRLPTTVNLRRLLAKAFVAAHEAMALGQAVRVPEAEALFTSALLESLGEFALASAMPEVSQQIDDAVRCQGVPYEDAHLQLTGLTPHAVTALVAEVYEFPDELILAEPDWQDMPRWTAEDRRQAVVHLANACATNLFAPESAQILINFSDLLSKTTKALDLSLSTVETLMTEAFQKASELGASVDLDASCFALESAEKDTDRYTLIRTCAQLAEPTAK